MSEWTPHLGLHLSEDLAVVRIWHFAFTQTTFCSTDIHTGEKMTANHFVKSTNKPLVNKKGENKYC